MSAVLYQIALAAGDSGFTTDDIIGELAADLADGEIDAVARRCSCRVLQRSVPTLFDQDPATLPIPGDDLGRTVGDVKALVIEETEATAPRLTRAILKLAKTKLNFSLRQPTPIKTTTGLIMLLTRTQRIRRGYGHRRRRAT